jgi:N-acetylmuramoyl-L-alanine amidase
MKTRFPRYAALIAAFLSAASIAHGQYQGKTIGIDPGHGGSDAGAVGIDGSAKPNEADFNLDLSLRLLTRLTGQGALVRMTRTTDTYVSITARRNLANSWDPDAFMSIHNNSFSSSSANGTETLYYNNSALASDIQNAMMAEYPTLTNRGIKYRDNLGVLKTNAGIPTCLAECLFISNQAEFNIMNTSSGKNRFVAAFDEGFKEFLNLSSGPVVVAPTVLTQSASSVGANSATIRGQISNRGGGIVDERRFDWGLSSGTLNQAVFNVPGGTSFSSTLTGLSPETTYFYRAWAHNSAGWGMGSIRSFTTLAEGVDPDPDCALGSSLARSSREPAVIAKVYPVAKRQATMDQARGVRDGLLAQSTEGRALTELYYAHGEELKSILTGNDGVKLVTVYLGALSALPGMVTQPEEGVLSAHTGYFRLGAWLFVYVEASAGPELKADLQDLRSFLTQRLTLGGDRVLIDFR